MSASASKKITKSADSQGAVQLNELDPNTASASVKAAPKEPAETPGLLQPEKPSKTEVGGPDDYETKGHLQDIVRAHAIMADPVKMANVHKMLGHQVKSFNSIQDLKNYKNQTYGAKARTSDKVASTGSSATDEDGQ